MTGVAQPFLFPSVGGLPLSGHERPAGDGFEERLEFETLIASLSARFINLAPDAVDREVQAGLRQICELLGVELAVLWQWSVAAPDVIVPTHTYCVEEELAPTEPMRQEQYPWSRQQILAGRAIAVGSLSELPGEAAVDRETCLEFGIKSSACVPLSVAGGRAVGALGFNALREERAWPKALVERLQLLAQLFAGALAQKRHEQTLRESEARVRLAAESAGAGVWTLDYDGGTFWASEEARAIFGYEPEEVISLARLEASVHPEDRELVMGTVERARAGDGLIDIDYRIVRIDGETRWITSRGRRQSGAAAESERLMGVSIDITERKLAEEEHRKSEARLASATAIADLVFYEVDFEAGSAYVDERFHKLCGVAVERDQGLHAVEHWMEHIHPDDLELVVRTREQLHAGEEDVVSLEYRYIHPQRGTRWFHHRAGVARRGADGRGAVTYGVMRDVTDRRQMESEMRDLSRRLIRAHEEDRALLARELHDDVTQRLAVMAIGLGRAELAASDPAQAEAMLTVREQLVRLSEDIHSLAYQLHPSVLEELGLLQALEAECERLGRSGSLEVVTEFGGFSSTIGRDEALCLFRVAQEALNNVRRHSGAGVATMALRSKGDGVLLTVRDSGTGFDPDLPGQTRSLGLASMRERARAVGGTFDIESTPGTGTRVIAWVPGNGRQV